MTRLRHLFVTALVCAVILAGIASGWFQPLDNALRDLRFSLASRQSSGEVVFVEISGDNMAAVGSPSRLRSVYASAIDKLLAAGAELVVLDVTLRGTLGYFDDTALATSLTAAGGKARTVALPVMTESGVRALQLPHDRFAAVAPPVFADSVPEADNVFRSYRTRFVHEGWVIESLATALSPQQRVQEQRFLVDFGIELSTIPRVPMDDIAFDQFDADQFNGKKVVIGLSDHSVQNSVVAPRYGVLPITAIQLLAAETVLQDRMLVDTGMVPIMAIVVLVGLVFAILRSRMLVISALAGSLAYAGLLEFAALALHVHSGLLLDTAAIHFAQAGFLLSAFWHELEARGRSLNSAARERDSTRGILARVIADNFDGVIVVDHTGTVRAASRLAEELISGDLRGKHFADVLPDPFKRAVAKAIEGGKTTDRASQEVVSSNGECRTIDYVVTLSAVSEAEVSSESAGRVACLTFRDVTERKAVEEQLTFLAQHDPLTGAASRVKFVECVTRQLGTPAERARGVSVFLVGLTRLKVVNDTLGHAYGDSLLKQVVSRLELMAPLAIGRLEGNSFSVLRGGVLSEEEGAAFADRIIETLSRPYVLDGHHAIVGACVGMTDTDLSGSTAEILITHASLALSIASDIPGNTAVTFSREMDTRIKNKQDMEVALRAALEKGEFAVHYQPQVDLDSGEIIGVEALTRWTHPELGNVSPAEFIPAAEETGLIIELGRWVLMTACAEVATWPKPVRLSVNVSPLQFEYGDIIADVCAALTESGLAPDRLDIEITENLLVTETSHVSAQLTKLRSRGVGIALDDFGTGYSSLSYLGRLPVDKIKIDQSFVRGLPEDTEATAIVRAVLMLSESLGKDVIAEGIETQDQAWLLRLAGCRTGQGYLFARPAPAADILELLSDQMEARTPQVRIG